LCQCLDCRIPDKQPLTDEIAAWEHHRARHAKANWHFTNVTCSRTSTCSRQPGTVSLFVVRNDAAITVRHVTGTLDATAVSDPRGNAMKSSTQRLISIALACASLVAAWLAT